MSECVSMLASSEAGFRHTGGPMGFASRHDPGRGRGDFSPPMERADRRPKTEQSPTGVPRPLPPPIRVFSQLGVRLPADLAGRLKAFSVSSGQSLNAIVTSALERYLNEKESDRSVSH